MNKMNVDISSTETINTNDQIIMVDPFVAVTLPEGNIHHESWQGSGNLYQNNVCEKHGIRM